MPPKRSKRDTSEPTVRSLTAELGGILSIAGNIGVSIKSVEGWMVAGKIPSRWYVAICAMAEQRGMPHPPKTMFSFVPVQDIDGPPSSDSSESAHNPQ